MGCDFGALLVLAVIALHCCVFCEPIPKENTTDEDQYVSTLQCLLIRIIIRCSSQNIQLICSTQAIRGAAI